MNSDKLKEIYSNTTFIDISQKIIDYLYKHFNLDKEREKIYIVINNNKSEDLRKATSDYNYRVFLENSTELNLSSINEDIYVNIYVPIENLVLAKFNESIYFSQQGYDIYDKNSEFYHDFCVPSYQGENDLTLEDRKKYIYANNVTLCQDNCDYEGVEQENKRIICSCNLNLNKKYLKEDNFLNEDDGNFITYFLDKINYKLFKCYSLIKNFENLKKNYAFYTILVVFIIMIILSIFFFCYSIPSINNDNFKYIFLLLFYTIN